MEYYCHACRRICNVITVNNTLQCSICGGGFVELQDEPNFGAITGFLHNFMGGNGRRDDAEHMENVNREPVAPPAEGNRNPGMIRHVEMRIGNEFEEEAHDQQQDEPNFGDVRGLLYNLMGRNGRRGDAENVDNINREPVARNDRRGHSAPPAEGNRNPGMIRHVEMRIGGGGAQVIRMTHRFDDVPDVENADGGPAFREAFGLLASGNAGNYALGEHDFAQILTHLMNQEQAVQPRIAPEDIVRLPMTEVNEKQVENQLQCVTCIEDFKLKEKAAILDCDHIFHKDCIEPWLRLHNTCPICRSVLDPNKWPKGKTLDVWELD